MATKGQRVTYPLKSATTWDEYPNWPYGDGGSNQVYDLRVPRNGIVCPPVIWVHGGGWQTGTEDPRFPDGLPFDHTILLKRGFAVASVRYELSGEAPHPEQIRNVLAAIRDLRAHAAYFRIDPARFIGWGGSAGGHLLLLAGLRGAFPEFQAGNWAGTSAALTGLLVDFAPSNLRGWAQTPRFTSWASPTSQLGLLFGGRSVLDIPDEADAASPALWVPANAPKLFLRHGTNDTIVPLQQSKDMRDAYVAKGLSSLVYLQEVPGKDHADPAFYTNSVVGGAADLFTGWL